MKMSGWERLICPYFSPDVVRILGDYFRMHSFIQREAEFLGVQFARNPAYVEIGYILESAPHYAPELLMGLGDEKYDNDGNPMFVPAWFLLANDSPERRYSFWRFSNSQELETTLRQIKDTILEPYFRPLWENQEELRLWVDRFRSHCAGP